jgi:hypothetical protein
MLSLHEHRRLYTAAVPLKGTLLFCAVSDEENGGVYGTKFLLEDSVLRDTFAADYTLSELGGATLPDRYLSTQYHTFGLILMQYALCNTFKMSCIR